MRKRLLVILLLAVFAAGLIVGSGFCRNTEAPHAVLGASNSAKAVKEDGWYDSRDEVALYLRTYGHLPYNYVTKNEARKAGWESGSLEKFFPGCSIGGDVFQNREGLLPKADGRTYYECDIDTAGRNSRGAKRIVFSNDGLIYYTSDRYESFTLLYEPTSRQTSSESPAALKEDGRYSSKDEVALYLYTYGHLPSNFVTKRDARKAGWEGGSLEKYFPGCSIGGDVFRNLEEQLPTARGRTYYECDIDTAGKNSRGAKRIVFSNDGLIYYTGDHYETFTLLYGEE